MSPSEQFAVDEFLEQYPKDASFDDILYLLLDDEDESIEIWDVFANIDRRTLANCISNTETHFFSATNLVRK